MSSARSYLGLAYGFGSGVQGSMRLELGRKLGLGVFSVSIRMVGARVVSFS